MSLSSINHLSKEQLRNELTKCCGSAEWVEKMCSVFPVPDAETLFRVAAEKWLECSERDWLEAFSHHPKIGDARSLREKFPITGQFAEKEQSGVKDASDNVLEALVQSNISYEKKFGYIFIVSASGKSAEEMLAILQARMNNEPHDEIKISMLEQQKITALRLKKILES